VAHRSLALAGALVVLWSFSTGLARADTYCVTPATGCDGAHTFANLQAALTGVAGNGVGDTIQLGAATYAQNGLTYSGTDPVSLVGAGTGSTTIQRAAPATASPVITAGAVSNVSLSHLRVHLLFMSGSVLGPQLDGGGTVDDVVIDGEAGSYSPNGIRLGGPATLSHSSIDLPAGTCVSLVNNGATTTATITDDVFRHCGIGINSQSGTNHFVRLRIIDSGIGVDAGGGSTNTLEDSLLTFSNAGAEGLLVGASSGPTTITANHVTIVGPGSGTGAASSTHVTQNATLNLFHTIIRNFTVSLSRTSTTANAANIVADYNDYGVAAVSESGNGSITSTHVYNNVDPLFVNAGAGDYHLSATSPLVDQDLAPLAAGESPFDFDGNVRIINDKRDLGAYEHVLFPGTVTGEASGVAATSATVSGLVNPGGAQTSWQVVYGTSPTAITSATTAATLSPSVANLAVSSTLTGLSPGTTYYYGFTATNSAGTSSPNLRSFTTAGGPAAPKPALSGLKLSPTSFLAARSGASLAAATGARLSYRLSGAATVTFRVRRLLPGVRSGKRCVAPGKARRKGRRCTRAKLVKGSFKRVSTAGANSARFSGRVGRRALARGRYRLTGTPSAAAGRGRAISVNFKIVGLAKKR
jgi:hypothetical protein